MQKGFKARCEQTAGRYRKRLGVSLEDPLPYRQLARELDVVLWTPGDIPGLDPEREELVQSWDFTFKDTAGTDYVEATAALAKRVMEGAATLDVPLIAEAVQLDGEAGAVADVPAASVAEDGLAAAEFVVAIDMFHTESIAHADVILPALGFAECFTFHMLAPVNPVQHLALRNQWIWSERKSARRRSAGRLKCTCARSAQASWPSSLPARVGTQRL